MTALTGSYEARLRREEAERAQAVVVESTPYTAACDGGCGRDAEWVGMLLSSGPTTYAVTCPACGSAVDGLWPVQPAEPAA